MFEPVHTVTLACGASRATVPSLRLGDAMADSTGSNRLALVDPDPTAGADRGEELAEMLRDSPYRVLVVEHPSGEVDVQSWRETLSRRQRDRSDRGVWLSLPPLDRPSATQQEVERARWAGFHGIGMSMDHPATVMTADLHLPHLSFAVIRPRRLAERVVGRRPHNYWHPAVLRLIQQAAHHAQQQRALLVVADDDGSDGLYSMLLFGLGAPVVALPATHLAPLAAQLEQVRLTDLRIHAESLLGADDGPQAREWMRELFQIDRSTSAA